MVSTLGAVLGCGASQRASGPVGSGGKPAVSKESTAAEPAFDVKAAMGREANGLTKHKVVAGKWQAEILAASRPVVQTENNVWMLPIDIGTQSPVQCFVYETILDPG